MNVCLKHMTNSFHSFKEIISVIFQTDRNTGILLYAVGGAPHYSHIIALLHSGFVNVSIAFENQDWDFSISIELDRNR